MSRLTVSRDAAYSQVGAGEGRMWEPFLAPSLGIGSGKPLSELQSRQMPQSNRAAFHPKLKRTFRLVERLAAVQRSNHLEDKLANLLRGRIPKRVTHPPPTNTKELALNQNILSESSIVLILP